MESACSQMILTCVVERRQVRPQHLGPSQPHARTQPEELAQHFQEGRPQDGGQLRPALRAHAQIRRRPELVVRLGSGVLDHCRPDLHVPRKLQLSMVGSASRHVGGVHLPPLLRRLLYGLFGKIRIFCGDYDNFGELIVFSRI